MFAIGRHTVIALAITAATAILAAAQMPAPSSKTAEGAGGKAAIERLLRDSVKAWNRGDLTGFMESYAQSESLRFATGARVYRGWEAALERYRRRYGTNPESMGELAFEDLEITRLAPGAAVVFGRYRLKRGESESTGLFTLTLKKKDGDWRILHDHTSTASGQ